MRCSTYVPGPDLHLMAEEEGSDLPQYEGGTRRYALACYSRNSETKEFTLSPQKRWLDCGQIRPVFLARLSRYEEQSKGDLLPLARLWGFCEEHDASRSGVDGKSTISASVVRTVAGRGINAR
jgi:hypothetical protein